MSELLPESKEYEYEEEEEGVTDKLRHYFNEILEKTRSEEEEEESKGRHGSISFNRGEDKNKDKSIIEEIDRFTAIVIFIEVLLVIYLILAVLGIVPFF